jgi:hypothetical protein
MSHPSDASRLHDTREAMRRVIDAFDADIIANITPPVSRSPRARALMRSLAAERMAECCGTVVWPSLTGPVHLAVVGDRFPKNTLEVIDPRHVAVIPSTSCVEHMQPCLDAAGAPHVLLVGGDALKQWRADVTVDEVEGVVGVWANRYMVTTVPAMPTQPARRREWFEDTRRRVRMLMDELVGGLSGRCVRCSEPFVRFDQDALPWCARCGVAEQEDVRVPLF